MATLTTPCLVSYPRTGSHWLRAALEAATGRPGETLAFFGPYPDDVQPTLVHTHDLDLKLEAERVVYLWRRDVVSVVYSQLAYQGVTPSPESVRATAEEYSRHVRHWLSPGAPARDTLLITYEAMCDDISSVIAALCRWLNIGHPDLDAAAAVTRDMIRAVIVDTKAVRAGDGYEQEREAFRRLYGTQIEALV